MSQQILTPSSWQVSINKHSKTINFQEHSVISSKNVKNLSLDEHYINKSRLQVICNYIRTTNFRNIFVTPLFFKCMMEAKQRKRERTKNDPTPKKNLFSICLASVEFRFSLQLKRIYSFFETMKISIFISNCLLIGITNGLVIEPTLQQHQHQPYYLINYNPQIVPWLSKMPISTYGLFDVDIPRIVSEYKFESFTIKLLNINLMQCDHVSMFQVSQVYL